MKNNQIKDETMMYNIEIKETAEEKADRIKKINEMFANQERICEKYKKTEPKSRCYKKLGDESNKKFDYKKHYNAVINTMTLNNTTF
jgi:hypothetical protein